MRVYQELAKYYDTIDQFKNYEKEARKIQQLIRRKQKSSGDKLLDVPCGTGNHLTYLKNVTLWKDWIQAVTCSGSPAGNIPI